MAKKVLTVDDAPSVRKLLDNLRLIENDPFHAIEKPSQRSAGARES